MKRRLQVLLLVAIAMLWLGTDLWIRAQRQVNAVDRLGWIKERVRRQFPDAPQLSTADLARRLAADEPLTLLDVRRPEEYAVSHLAGAIQVDPEEEPSLPPGLDASRPVVAYCSVGWRSSKWVEALRADGIDAVNLEGSIFQWAAEDRPLVRGDQPVTVVHPYGRAWAWLVDPQDRADLR
ncbi:MAG: rhodanese-like domain-containing protein [Acidobacteriota bacterium]